jgi:hypothetical protein
MRLGVLCEALRHRQKPGMTLERAGLQRKSLRAHGVAGDVGEDAAVWAWL